MLISAPGDEFRKKNLKSETVVDSEHFKITYKILIHNYFILKQFLALFVVCT